MQIYWGKLNKFEGFDQDNARRGRLLNTLLTGMSIFCVLGIIGIAIIVTANGTWSKPGNIETIIAAVVFLVGTVGLGYLNQYSTRSASFLFLALLTAVFIFSDEPGQLANGRSSFVFFIPIAISSLLLAPASSFFFAFAGGGLMVLLASQSNVLPNVSTIAGGFMLALVSWLSARSLEQALQDLRAVNQNLDHLVEQKTRELAATLSRELVVAGRNQAILNSIADGVIVFDENNLAILANPALSRLTDIPIENLVNRSVVDFILNESLSSSRSSLQHLFEKPEETTTGIRVNWGNKTLSASIARVHDSHDKGIGTVAVFRDITREVELEKMKDTFMGVVSHELRTPLNAILGYAEMLKEGVYGAINDKQSNVAQRVMNSTQRLLTIVTDLLDQAQIQSGKLKIRMVSCKPAELLESLRGVMDRIALDKGIEFKTDLDPAMPPVIMGDPQRLQQMMINLANNAIKFTERGSVSVKILRIDAGSWQIRTTDTGGGIPLDAQEYIFESFRQVDAGAIRQHGGVGLGLSIVKQLVELMRGKITVESEVGKGSTFIVTLPIVINDDSQPTITDPRKEKS
jgi:PAS domain S-box-containing protein